ncbi:hypothetical protein F5B22DRAFT_653424 [Xylaria bambusicola]|uniref:uncharacterized protein n=1 Tax=Xylaria bambusicola TaxID=326684 RepID=UPI002008B562|nr:uncharacterized protein F5B22DRAFT_653424 [Xylaria bambusicola]KAI0521002.1 hypothetical protein F5B22DRAFT_653424 [Xylaria bambusicola]
MPASFTQRPHPSYRALPHAQEDANAEYYPLADYQSSASGTIRYLADVPHIPTPSWPAQVDHTAFDKTNASPDSSCSGATPTWLPYTLRWLCLTSILAFTAVLEILVVIAHAISAHRKGLVADDGSGSIVIFSKLVPTLLAVSQGILLSILLNDVRRTQPFANLASPSGASAAQSLTWIADAWWECLLSSLPKRHVKKTDWAMLCATVAFMFSFLVMSPFSSTLFVSQDVLFAEEVPFSQLDISSALPLQSNPIGTTYFRTVSSLLQNVTTSAWITDSYAVLPFWPSTMGSAPLGPILSDSVQTWSAKTTVFDVEVNCEQMNLVEFVSVDWFTPELNTTIPSHRVRLLSPSGCALNLTLLDGGDLAGIGGAVWSNLREINSTTTFGSGFDSPLNISGCMQDEIIFLSTSLYQATFANATVIGQACTTSYFTGNPSVTVTLSKSASLVEVDELEYLSVRELIPNNVADLPSFQRVFLNNTNWNVHLRKPLGSRRAFASGPAIMLSALYDFSPEKMAADSSFTQNAGRVKQRFFGELLRDVFDTTSISDAVKTTGTIADTKRRVVAVSAVAIILETSLLLQLILLSTVFVTTRLSRRPLGLFGDPAPPIRVAKLISNEANTLQSLDSLHSASSKELECSLSDKRYLLSQGRIRLVTGEYPQDTANKSTSQEKGSHQPTFLNSAHTEKQSHTFSMWMFVILIFLLSAVLTAVAYLFWYSDAVGLYQTAFVYAFDVSVGGLDLGDVNPASLITTLVAVSIGLWWGSLDTALRRIQPYLVLANKPITRSSSEGVSISYISSYLLWAAWRALKRSHWVLALVCTGAFLSEILTIAMSSLWSREAGTLPLQVDVQRQLELRQVPQLSAGTQQFTSHAGNYKKTILAELFENMRTSWIYGAAVQTSLNGSEPPWSSGGWSFVPYDLSMVPSTKLQNTGNQTAAPKYPTNATIETSAIRARLECSPYEHLNLEESKTWLTEWDLTNSTQWVRDKDAKALSRGFELGLSGDGYNGTGVENVLLYLDQQPNVEGNYSTFFANNKRFQCCQNKTDNEQITPGSVGYWSPNLRNGSSYPDFAGAWPTNFTIKWIHGLPVEGYCGIQRDGGCFPRLMWAEKPRMAVLNCMPIIETADATVTVDGAGGNVVEFSLHAEPQPDLYAWSDDFKQHKYNNSLSGFEINITTSHGVLFVTALLGAADLDEIQGTNLNYLYTESESIDDQTFNIRQPGLNVDLMTYSMLSLVNYDHEALLDLDTLKYTAQQTFTALFQHFASNNVSTATGGYVFQPPGERLPDDLDGPTTKSPRADEVPVSETVTMHISRSVELLKISKPAAWICLLILAYLIVVGVTLTIASQKYRTVLLRRINSIADVAVLMAGSHRLLELAREKTIDRFKLDSGTKVRLGWFNDKNGAMRWGIEVVGEEQSEVTNALLNNNGTSHLQNDNPPYATVSSSGYFTSRSQTAVNESSATPFGSQSGVSLLREPGEAQIAHRENVPARKQNAEAFPIYGFESQSLIPNVNRQARSHPLSSTRTPSIVHSIDLGMGERPFMDYHVEDTSLRNMNSEQDSLIRR